MSGQGPWGRGMGREGPYPVHVHVSGRHKVLLEERGLPSWEGGTGQCQWAPREGRSS